MSQLFRKLPARSMAYVLPLIISLMMSCIVSGVATFRSIGFREDFLHIWMTGWPVSWVVAYPVLMLVLPLAKNIAFLIVEKDSA